jgi:hypothetical protein
MNSADVAHLKNAIKYLRKGADMVADVTDAEVGFVMIDSVEKLIGMIEFVIDSDANEVVDNVVYVKEWRK